MARHNHNLWDTALHLRRGHKKNALLIGIFMICECGLALTLSGSNETVQAAYQVNTIEKALAQGRYICHIYCMTAWEQHSRSDPDLPQGLNPSMGSTIYMIITVGSKLHPAVHLASATDYL